MSERHLLILGMKMNINMQWKTRTRKQFRCAPHQFFFSIQQTPKGKILITCTRRHLC